MMTSPSNYKERLQKYWNKCFSKLPISPTVNSYDSESTVTQSVNQTKGESFTVKKVNWMTGVS